MKKEITIPAVWSFLRLPGEPGKKVMSPFREDNNPSFSVYQTEDKEWRFKDFGQPGVGGDVHAFIKLAKQSGYELADKINDELDNLPEPPPFKEISRSDKQLMWKNLLHKGELVDLWQLSKLRKLKIETLERAQDLGFLRFCKWRNHASWVVTDRTLQCAQARRMDGSLWAEKDDAKSITLPGSIASWPLGCTTIPDNWDESFLLVEGGPDFIAAHQYAEGSGQAVCAMMGVSNNFTQDTVKHFKNARVFICPHNDVPGQEAAEKWRRQLNGVAEVIITKIPSEFKDMNQWVSEDMS